MTRTGRIVSVLVIALSILGWTATGLAQGPLGPDRLPGGRGVLDAGAPTLDPSEYPGYGRVSPQVLLDINLYVPHFNQCDSAWGSEVMQTCNQTICNAGCALTSTAMVFKYYGATSKNPSQLNSCLGNSACPIYWGTAASSCSEGHATFVGKYSYSIGLLADALQDGRPPILELVKGSSTHWVVVRRVLGDGLSPGNYSINDPNGGVYRNLTYYTDNGWTGRSIVIYSKN